MESNLLPLFITYGYPIIFVLAFVEGPIIAMAAAFFASMGYFNIVLVYCLVVVADLLADVCWYMAGFIGRSRGFWVAARFLRGKDKGKTFADLEKRIIVHQGKLIFMAKLTHALGLPFLIAAGACKINFKKFIWFSMLATVVKSLLFILIGYYYGQAHTALSRYLGYSAALGAAVLAIALASALVVEHLIRRSFKKYE